LVRIFRADAAGRLAEPLATLTRRAYADSDPLPGLPAPDGAFETPEAVHAELAAGTEVYAAWPDAAWPDADGPDTAGAIAALRVHRREAAWEISRISVLPGWRGTGLVRLLVAEVSRQAADSGVPAIELAAVVERCLAPLYAGLGFRVRCNWPSPDKQLSEVTMRLAEPATPLRFGWQDAAFTEHAAVVGWFLAGDRLFRIGVPAGGDPLADTARAGNLLGEPDALLAGVDLSRRPTDAGNRVAPVGRGRLHPEHLMPRTRHPDTLAIWRPVPGRELPMTELEAEARR